VIEPLPREVSASTLANKRVSVGIVLEEDACSLLQARTHRFALDADGRTLLPPGESFSIQLLDNEIAILDSTGTTLHRSACLSLSFKNQEFPEPALSLEPVIAGRQFHWKKTIKADYTGEFMVSAKSQGIQIVNTLPFEDYLACVVASEMSADAPAEFIKAQTTVARSWAVCFLYGKHPGCDYELCNDDDCQRYQGVTYTSPASLQAATETAGDFLVNTANQVIPGYYSKSCGGITETASECFGLDIEELVSVNDGEHTFSPDNMHQWVSTNSSLKINCAGKHIDSEALLGTVDEPEAYFRWEHIEKKTDLAIYLNQRTSIKHASLVIGFIPRRAGASGRIHELSIVYLDKDGKEQSYLCQSQYEIRSLLHASFLYSSAFIAIDEGDSFLFKGAGWGHGVGLCQIGACDLALQGLSYTDILRIYFPKADVLECY